MNYWLKIVGALAAVWLVAATAIHSARAAKPTAESVTAYLPRNSLNGASGSGREKIIGNVESICSTGSPSRRLRFGNALVYAPFGKVLALYEPGPGLVRTLAAGSA